MIHALRAAIRHPLHCIAAALTVIWALAGAATAVADDEGPGRTTAEGVFTAEQAQQGLKVHEKFCAKCHHYSYFQASFLISWQNQPVSALYDLIEMKMPEDRPGSLKPREYASLLAYVFELNGLPAGDEKLDDDHAVLEQIRIAAP